VRFKRSTNWATAPYAGLPKWNQARTGRLPTNS